MLAWPRPTSSHFDLLHGLLGSHGPPSSVVMGEPHCCMSQGREHGYMLQRGGHAVMGPVTCAPFTGCVYE